jgi:putative transcriptional regulator
MPSMTDPRFERAVILVCGHDENGAMGLVLNQTLADVKFEKLLAELGIVSDIHIRHEDKTIPVMNGGPVETTRGFLLHSGDYRVATTVPVTETVAVTATLDVLEALAKGQGPQDALFLLGYAGWDAGQLDSELRQNAWLVADCTSDIIFSTDDTAVLWDRAVRTLGVDPALLSMSAGNA